MRFLCLLLPALLAPAAVQANDLIKIYDEARANDAQVEAAAHQRDAGVEALPIARGDLLPQITASGTDSRSRDKVTADLGIDPATGLPITSATRTSSPYSYGVTLTQTIFNWQQISLWRQSGDLAALAEITYHSAEQDLRLRVAQAYFNVLAALDTLRSNQAENKALEQQLEQAKRRFDVGLSAITDVQDAQARFDATAANVIAGQQAYDAAKEALALITGHPYDKLATLQEDIPLPAPDPADVNAWVHAASENNFSLLQAQLVSESADKGVQIARGGHYPSLGLSAREFRSLQGGLSSAHDDSTSVALSLNLPLFAGGKTQAQVRQAVATHEQRLSELELARRTAALQTRNAYQGVLSGAARVKALKQAVVSNTTSVEASNTGLEVGTRTAVDVLTATQLLYAAQRDYYKSRYDYLIAVLQLKAAAGRLTEADLADIDRLLVNG